MRTRWFDRPLETIAMLWRVERRDGITLGFAAHDRDIMADHVRYHAAPGMLPSAIEMDDGLDPLDMDIGGALSHGLIRRDDLAAGRWDHAAVRIGLIDWAQPGGGVGWFWHGHLGAVSMEGNRFSAELRGLKAKLDQPFVPAASPSCRAEFCGIGCGLSRAAHERVAVVEAADAEAVVFAGIDEAAAAGFVQGSLRWIGGRNSGLSAQITGLASAGLLIDGALLDPPQAGDRAALIEGCDKSLATCAGRYGNAINFRGEPHLPGNDLLTRFTAF
jgi:uncharacterized phage protein (TIGR02218 family)